MNEHFDIIQTASLTEKSSLLSEKQNKYVFRVSPRANKIQIKQAVEQAFANKKIQVADVNILRVVGKTRRRGRSIGMTRSWKKAVVTLKPGQRLDLFEGV